MESILKSTLKFVLKFVMLEKILKNHCLPKFALDLLEVGLTKIPGDHETLSIVRHVGLHVDFSSMKSSLGL